MVLGAVKGRAQARPQAVSSLDRSCAPWPRDARRDEGRPNGVDHASGGSNKGLSKKG